MTDDISFSCDMEKWRVKELHDFVNKHNLDINLVVENAVYRYIHEYNKRGI